MVHLKLILPVTCFSCLVSVLYLVLLWQVGNAEQTSLTSSDSIIKTLVEDATSALSSGNTTKTLQNLSRGDILCNKIQLFTLTRNSSGQVSSIIAL